MGECGARAALAQAYEATGSISEAISQFEILLSVAAQAGELDAQAQACRDFHNQRMLHNQL